MVSIVKLTAKINVFLFSNIREAIFNNELKQVNAFFLPLGYFQSLLKSLL